MKNKVVFLFFFLSLSFQGFSQIDTAFLKHLSVSNLKREQEFYLNELKTSLSKDSFFYFKAKFDFQYSIDDTLSADCLLAKAIILKDSDLVTLLSFRFLNSSKRNREIWFETLKYSKNISLGTETSMKLFELSNNPFDTSSKLELPIFLLNDLKKYQKAYKKKAGIAGVLSIIPGLGNYYIGNNISGFNALTTNVIFGASCTEAIVKLGVRHPLTILNFGFFGIYYASNIYGSYSDCKKKKLETKINFLSNASKFYLFNFHPRLY